MNEQNICDSELDSEYMASKYIKGLIYPVSYTKLRSNFSQIQVVQTFHIVDQMYIKLIDMICNKENMLDDYEIEKFWKGNHKSLYELLLSLLKYTQVGIEEMGFRMQDVVDKTANMLDTEMRLPSWEDKAHAINKASIMSQEIEQQQQLGNELQKNEGILQNILEEYGSGKYEKLPTKEMKPKYSDEYKFYATQLMSNMGDYLESFTIAQPLSRALMSAAAMYPEDELDPFKVDQVNNLLYVLANPDKYDTEFKKNTIISEDVAKAFQQSYPQYAMKSMEACTEILNKKDSYQEQLTFSKDFALGRDDSDLIKFCATHI